MNLNPRRNDRKSKKNLNREKKLKEKSVSDQIRRQRSKSIGERLTSVSLKNLLEIDAPERDRLLSKLLRNPVSKSTIVPAPFPRNIQKLGHFGTRLKSSSNAVAIYLVAGILKHYKQRTTEAYRLVDLFYDQLLRQEISKSAETLTLIQDKFGWSLWLIENTILMSELREGITGNRKSLSTFYDVYSDGIVPFYATFFAQRIETGLTARYYRGGIQSLFNDAKTKQTEESRIATIAFHIDRNDETIPKHIGAILDNLREYSLLDLAIGFRVLLPLSVIGEHVTFSRKAQAAILSDAQSLLGQSIAQLLHTHFNSAGPRGLTPISKTLFELADHLSKGDFNVAADIASVAIQKYPNQLELYTFLVQAEVLGGLKKANIFPDSSIASHLLDQIRICESRDHSTEDALNAIAKIAYTIGSSSLSLQLSAYYYSAHFYATPFQRLELSAPACVTPALIIAMASCDRDATTHNTHIGGSLNSEWLEWLRTAPDVNFKKTDPPQTPDRTRQIYLALIGTVCIKRKLNDTACLLLTALLEEADHNYFRTCAFTGLVRIAVKEHKYADAFDLVAKAFSNDESLLIGLGERLVSQARDTWPVSLDDMNALSGPIVFWLSKRGELSEKDCYLLHVAVDDFLTQNGFRTVSAFLTTEPSPSPTLLAFLYYVCTTQVLKRNYLIKGNDALDRERIQILQFLLQRGGVRYTGLARAEIVEINQRDLLRAAIRHVEQGRIFVNIPGLERALAGENLEKFQRFVRTQKIQDIDARKHLQIDHVPVDGKSIIVFTDYSEFILRELVEEIRDVFVCNSSHGLITYISMHIRHGYISSQMRGQFDTHRLATRQDAAGEYQDNLYWLERLGNCSAEVKGTVNEYLKGFSRRLDEEIEEVNLRWIRVRHIEHKDGMLDYSITGYHLATLLLDSLNVSAHGQFVTLVIDLLWRITDECLERIRARISNELLTRVLNLLQELEDRVVAAVPLEAGREFMHETARCRNAVQSDFVLFAGWFTRTSDQIMLKAFPLELAFEVALKTTRQFHPAADVRPLIDAPLNLKIHGKWFRPFVEMVVILFDNAVKNSPPELSEFRCSVLRSTPALLTITVINPVREDTSDAELRRTIDLLNAEQKRENIAKLQSERNSGLAKVKKLLYDDLRQEYSELFCDIEPSRHFRVSIALKQVDQILEADL